MRTIYNIAIASVLVFSLAAASPELGAQARRSTTTTSSASSSSNNRSTATTATVYNAVPEQCGDNPTVTASGRLIRPEKVQEMRIIAMERTMMAKHGIHYGDTILVKGAGIYDGEWVVEDTMHPRYAGQDKIDFLVPADIKLGRWDNVKVYKQIK